MGLSVVQGLTKSLAMTILSEIGDKTFFAAALILILAMRHPRRHVLAGCLGALIVMTILSAVVGWAAPNLIWWIHHITTMLFLGFGLWSLRDAFNDNADLKSNGGQTKKENKDEDDLKRQNRAFLTQFFSPILLKAFSITFFGEWGDKSQLATIGLATDQMRILWVLFLVASSKSTYISSLILLIRPSVVHHSRCLGREDSRYSNIREKSGALWRCSFHCFRYPVLACNSGIVINAKETHNTKPCRSFFAQLRSTTIMATLARGCSKGQKNRYTLALYLQLCDHLCHVSP